MTSKTYHMEHPIEAAFRACIKSHHCDNAYLDSLLAREPFTETQAQLHRAKAAVVVAYTKLKIAEVHNYLTAINWIGSQGSYGL